MAIIEAKRATLNLQEAEMQDRAYAEQWDGVPYLDACCAEDKPAARIRREFMRDCVARHSAPEHP